MLNIMYDIPISINVSVSSWCVCVDSDEHGCVELVGGESGQAADP